MKKKLNLGVFLSCDVPNFSKKGVFENVNDDTDVRIGFEFAVTGRYKLNLFKNMESNPYIGFICGWEYFDIQQPTDTESFKFQLGFLRHILAMKFTYISKCYITLN